MNRKIILFANDSRYVANLRRELIERIIAEDYELIVCTPQSKNDILIKELGCEKISINYDVHSMKPLHDLQLFIKYFKLLRENRPLCVITFTIKPNIYVSLACRILKIKCLSNITGLGPIFEKNKLVRMVVLFLYRISMKRRGILFFQNEPDMQYLLNNKIGIEKSVLIPGSGVNISRFVPLLYPPDNIIEFVFISRIVKEKGIDQYLEAAKYIKNKYPNTRFHICGFCEEEYEEILKVYETQEIIKYHGLIDDVRDILKVTHCTVHPTYYPEGMSNVLLESCACARPIITTDRSGCREVVEDGINGYMIPQQNSQALIDAVEKFIALTNEERKQMGLLGRKKVENEFDRQIVIDKYLEILYEL